MLMLLLLLLNLSCTTNPPVEQVIPPEVTAPLTPNVPDFTPKPGPEGLMTITQDEALAVFSYFVDVAGTYKQLYQMLQAGVVFTDESMDSEIEFNSKMLEALYSSFGGISKPPQEE